MDTAVDVVRDIEQAVRNVRGRHADLVDQLQRAAESVVLNLAEGAGRSGKDKTDHRPCAPHEIRSDAAESD